MVKSFREILGRLRTAFSISSRPEYDGAAKILARQRKQKRSITRQRQSTADDYIRWQRRHGLVPLITISRFKSTGFRCARIRATIVGRVKRYRLKLLSRGWLSSSQYKELKKIDAKAKKQNKAVPKF